MGNTTVKLFRHLYTTVLLHSSSSEEVALGVVWDFFGLAYLYLMGTKYDHHDATNHFAGSIPYTLEYKYPSIINYKYPMNEVPINPVAFLCLNSSTLSNELTGMYK